MLFPAKRRRGRRCRAALLGFGLILAAGPGAAGETTLGVSQSDAPPPGQVAESQTPIHFDIPVQPLARALMAYGTVTGLEVYYNAAVAQGRVSAAVTGAFTPAVALRMLLQGSGLVPRMTGPGDFTVVPAPHVAPAAATSVAWAGGAYEPYFAAIQRQVARALCRTAGNGLTNDGAIFRIWLDASGVIARADVSEAGGDVAGGHALESAVQGLAVGMPPLGMPQPVTLAIFPPSAAAQTCPPQGAD
jgi:hypothetical protein